MANPRQENIERTLRSGLSPAHLEVENESFKHRVPPGSETHFKIVIVSRAFEGLSAVERHRTVHALLNAELGSGLHALALKTLTPDEWSRDPASAFRSPPCASK